MPAVLDDPALRRRLAGVFAECRSSYAETGRQLGLDKHVIRRLLLQRNGPIDKTRARLEVALLAHETQKAELKRTQSITETQPVLVPDLAEEVLRYVLRAVEAQRSGEPS